MARVTKFHDDGTVSVTDYAEPNYVAKRGKVLPAPKANWGTQTDGHGKPLDTDLAKKTLDEALGD